MTPAPDVEAVVARLRALETTLGGGPLDGVRAFNGLYLEVTLAVRDALTRQGGFEAPEFVAHLDVDFAELYFAACAAPAPSKAWAPLFERRGDRAVHPVQFAFAGMNAHLNHDLALALVSTATALGVEPWADAAILRDYRRVDAILATVQERVKRELTSGIVGWLDRTLGRLDDVLAIWKVEVARERAWSAAELLWHVRSDAAARREAELMLERLTGFATHALLVPVLPRWLPWR